MEGSKESEPIFGEGDATKHFSVKKRVLSEKGGGDSVNHGFGKDVYRKSNSVKRFGPFTERARTLKTEKLLSLIPSAQKSALRKRTFRMFSRYCQGHFRVFLRVFDSYLPLKGDPLKPCAKNA